MLPVYLIEASRKEDYVIQSILGMGIVKDVVASKVADKIRKLECVGHVQKRVGNAYVI